MTDAIKLPLVILVNLNKPPAADAKNAPRMTPKLRTVVESANIDEVKAVAASPCQYPQLPTSNPMNSATLDPHHANAEVIPHGSPRVISVKAFNTASTTAATIKGHDPLRILFLPRAL